MPAPLDEAVYRFCPQCGGDLERRLLKTGDPHRLVCAGCGFIFYLDPKVAVGTIITVPGEGIVMVKRAIEPGLGRWVFPGGYVDRGELVEDAARREALEEAGLIIRLDGLVNIYSYSSRSPIIIVYAATALGGTLAADEESSEVALFTQETIPWDLLAFRSTDEALRHYFSGVIHRVPAGS